MTDRLREIKEKLKNQGKPGGLYLPDAYDRDCLSWLIAEVERLREENKLLTKRLELKLDKHMTDLGFKRGTGDGI